MYHTFPFIQLHTLDVKYNDKMGPSGCRDIVVELKGFKERERGGTWGRIVVPAESESESRCCCTASGALNH